jgi:hypothetical protein
MRRILAVAGVFVLLVLSSTPAPSQTDLTVKDFIATCSKVKHVNYKTDSDAYINCLNELVFSMMAPEYCPPQDKDAQPDDTLKATIAWLKRHPEMSSMERGAGILAALKAMYCH